jgi:hypothetical protein
LAGLFISHGLPLSFKQEEIRYWRNRAAIEVLCSNRFPFYDEENINDTLEDHSMCHPHYLTQILS